MRILFLIFFVKIISANPLGINGKLDFGDASLKSDYKVVNINPGSSIKYKTIKSNDDLDTIGIVCVSGAGCNTTKSDNGNKNSNGTVQTDIVVHVETKVDLKGDDKFNSKSKSTGEAPIGDLPDVPVVVGYKGAELDGTTGRSFNPSPAIVISDLDPLLSTTKFMDPSSFSFQPSIQSRIDSSLADDFFYPPSTLSANSPIDSKVNININTPPATPSVSVALSANNNDKNYKYGYNHNGNGIELRTAYLQPSSFSNHYFSENLPHQYLFYPKKSSTPFNPVEFKHQPTGAHKSLWNYAYYPNNYQQNNYNHRHTSTTVCTCKTGSGINTTPSPATAAWHANHPQHNNGYGNSVRRNFNDPGSQINDKLAPPFSNNS